MNKFLILTLILFSSGGFSKEIEEDLDTVETIKYYGYPAERHYVQTPEGYINEVHRIPYGRDGRTIEGCSKKRPVLFMMHGLFVTSWEFVINLPSQSPAYVFADAGFDVWMGNVRGTTYGKNHTHLSPNDHQFWNFSLYDHAHSDLRTQIEYVLEQTGQESLFYVGHSQGTAVMFARLAEADKSWQSKIRTFFAWGPTAGFIQPDIFFKLLEIGQIQRLAEFVLDGRFGVLPLDLPHSVLSLVARVCGERFLTHACVTGFFLPQGLEKLGQLNETRVPIMVKHFPDTTSTLNILHWAQVFKYHELRQLDFGKKRNLQVYGQAEAPKLNIANIETPTHLYYSKDDHVTDATDVNKIIIKNMGPALKKAISLDHFSHYDYAAGLRANDEVYKPIIYDMYEDIEKNGC